jgi:hypothetical protein
MIDTSFNMYSDANGGDPDATSPTLRSCHKFLWSKSLPSGDHFILRDDMPGYYLHHSSTLGDFSLGSDAITHSYKNQINKKWLTTQIPKEVQELFDHGSTVGAYIVFPNKFFLLWKFHYFKNLLFYCKVSVMNFIYYTSIIWV